MKISILIQDFDLELLKFINNTQKKNVSIINILVAVKKKKCIQLEINKLGLDIYLHKKL